MKNAIRAGESKSSHCVVQAITDGNILDDQGGQQIAVRTDGKSPTLRAEMHGNIPCVIHAAAFCPEESAKTRLVGYAEEQAPTLRAGAVPAVVYDARGNGDGRTANTLTGDHNNRITDYSSVVVEPAYCLQGNCIDRNAQQSGSGISENVSHTLNTVDRHGVAYCIGNGQANQSFSENAAATLNCMHDPNAVVHESPDAQIRYIVRRLTPTECARLQGFADTWGHIDQKDKLTTEELAFWVEVRNTHAAINGKAVKEYTEKQILTWYNKLHTDSAEYKMWGNGIALPPALYCMQGIKDALTGGVSHEGD